MLTDKVFTIYEIMCRILLEEGLQVCQNNPESTFVCRYSLYGVLPLCGNWLVEDNVAQGGEILFDTKLGYLD